MLIFLIIITVISIYILNFGIIKDKTNVITTGSIMLIMIIVIGWGFVGIGLNFHGTEYETKNIYEKTKNEIIIKDSLDNKYIFNKKIDFDFITDTTTFHIIMAKNIYGGNIDYNIYYNVNKRKIKGLLK